VKDKADFSIVDQKLVCDLCFRNYLTVHCTEHQ